MEQQNFTHGSETETKPRDFKVSNGGGEGRNGTPRKKRNWPLIGGIAAAGLFVSGILALVIANIALEGNYTGKIEPGVSISGVYVGEMTRDQAREAVQKQLQGYTTRPVLLEFQDKKWQPTLEQLGVSLNIEGSLDQAFSFGKTGDFLKDTRLYKLMSPESHNLPLEIMMNEAKLKGYLSDISDRIRKDPVEPNIELKGTEVIATEGKIGFNVQYDKTYEAIKTSLVTLQPTDQNLLAVGDVPTTINTQEFNTFKTKLSSMLAAPVSIKFKDKTWGIDQTKLAGLFKVTRSTNPTDVTHFSYTVDRKFVEKFVSDLAPGINQAPKDGTFAWDGGKVVAKTPSQDGQQLVIDRSVDEIMKQINEPSPNREVNLIVDVKEPEINTNNLDKLGIKELIGEGVSQFAGSAYERATNIQVGAKHLTGKFIKPHSVFSFLDSIGEISQAQGYVKGYAIVADQTVPDVGGGICQVSTTTFRAAFYAGLPIVERNAHAYRVSWYEELNEPVGFDAAVYQPGVDMKFENNADTWIYLESSVTNGKLYVRLWGTKPAGQTVELVSAGISNVTPARPDRYEIDKTLGPLQKKQVDYAHKGLTTTITRVTKVNGAVVKEDKFPTTFQPWPNIIKVGPGYQIVNGLPVVIPTTTAAPTTDPGTPAPGGTTAPGTTPAAPATTAAPTTPAAPPTTKKP